VTIPPSKTYVECPCRRQRCEWNIKTQECSSSCVCRVVDEDLIEEQVEVWHRWGMKLWDKSFRPLYSLARPKLHEWLGWTEAEYKLWIEGWNPPGHEPRAEEQALEALIRESQELGLYDLDTEEA
jgi:hypothetical protein